MKIFITLTFFILLVSALSQAGLSEESSEPTGPCKIWTHNIKTGEWKEFSANFVPKDSWDNPDPNSDWRFKCAGTCSNKDESCQKTNYKGRDTFYTCKCLGSACYSEPSINT